MPTSSSTAPVGPPAFVEAVWLVNPLDVVDVAVGPGGEVWSAGAAGLATWAVVDGGGMVAEYVRSDRPFWCVDVGPDGRVWAGGDGVVAAWDGSVWSDWEVGTGLPSDLARTRCSGVVADADGAWFGYGDFDGGALRVGDDNVRRIAFDDLGADVVYAMAGTGDGVVWLQGATCLARVEGDRVDCEWPDPPGRTSDLAAGQSGTLWAVGSTGVFRLAETGIWRKEPVPGDEDRWLSLDVDASGEVWVGGDELWVLQDEDWVKVGRPADTPTAGWLRDLEADGAGRVVVAVAGRGLARFADGSWQGPEGTLAWRNTVANIASDGNGRVYITGRGAVDIVDGDRRAVAEIPFDGYLLAAGTRSGVFVGGGEPSLLLDGLSLEVVEIDALTVGGVSYLPMDAVADAQYDVWTVTQMGGLARLSDGRWEDLDPSIWAYQIAFSDGRLFALGSDRAWVSEGGEWAEVPSGRASYVGPGANGTFWLFGEGSVWRSDGQLRLQNGIPHEVWDLTEGTGGAVWMASSDGLACAMPTGTRTYGLAEGVPTTQVFRVFFSEPDTLWVGTMAGAIRLSLGGGGCPTDGIRVTRETIAG